MYVSTEKIHGDDKKFASWGTLCYVRCMENTELDQILRELNITPTQVAEEMSNLSRANVYPQHISGMRGGSRKVTIAVEIWVRMKKREIELRRALDKALGLNG